MARSRHFATVVFGLAVTALLTATPAAAGGSSGGGHPGASQGDTVALAAPANRWRFDPSIGLEGRGSIVGTGGSRLEVECGNGGAPVFWIETTPQPRIGAGENRRVTLVMDVDGKAYEHRFDCGDDSASCMSDVFPDPALVAALRRGSTVTLAQESTPIAAFSLKGSNAAISRLENCLSY